jgi:hypothetical protein
LVFLAPLIFAAWLWENGFTFPNLTKLGGGLISLSDWFLGGNNPTVKAIGIKLKQAEDIAKRVITNTIAQQELLQRQVNQKVMDQLTVKKQVIMTLELQIANIDATYLELAAAVEAATNDPAYKKIVDDLGLTTAVKEVDTPSKGDVLEKLNELLNGIQKAYEKMAEGDKGTVSQKNVENFKEIRKNFKSIVELPKTVLTQIQNTPPEQVGAKLKELGRDARSRLAKAGYNLGQFFSGAGTRMAGFFGGKTASANGGKPANPANATQKKPGFFNRARSYFSGSKAATNTAAAGVKKPGFFNRARSFLWRKPAVNSQAGLQAGAAAGYNGPPLPAGLLRKSRKNRRYQRR